MREGDQRRIRKREGRKREEEHGPGRSREEAELLQVLLLAHESERRLGLGNRGGGGWRIWISVGVGRLGKTRKEGGAGGWLDFWIGEDPEEEGTRRVAALGRGWMGQDP